MKKERIIFLFAGIGLGFVFLMLFDFGLMQWNKFIKPQKQNIKRDVFENTNSYVRGKNQDLLNYYLEHKKTEEKEAIEEIIRADFANFPEEKVKSKKLQKFLKKIKYGVEK